MHPPCHALITPAAVVFDQGAKQQPLERRSDNHATSLADGFAAAVADLFTLVDQARLRGRRVRVAVSDYWARPTLLTLPAKPHSDEAIDNLLASHYRRIYGELMTGWHWCWSQHESRLTAVAWPAGAWDALQAGLAQRDCVLASARPLGLLLGALVGQLPGAGWLVILERTHVTLMHLHDGALDDWRVVPVLVDGSSMATQLPMQLARESARCGDNSRALVIIDFDAATDLPPVRQNLLDAGWSVRDYAVAELSGSWVWRLQQRLRLSRAA